VSRFELNIPEFKNSSGFRSLTPNLEIRRDLEPEELLDWVLAVEKVLEFNRVLDEQ
jgi:hypothetical protein